MDDIYTSKMTTSPGCNLQNNTFGFLEAQVCQDFDYRLSFPA